MIQRRKQLKMKFALVTVTIGDKTIEMFNIAERFFKDYANKINADFLIISEKKYTPIHSPNLEKFQIYELFDIYDRILYCDSDILISPRTPDIFKIVPETHIGAVYDCADNDELNRNRNKEIEKAKRSLGDINWYEGYINSGVICLSEQHRNVFEDAKQRKKLESIFCDQTLINYNIKKYGFPIFKLDKKFNAMQINGYTSQAVNQKNKQFPSRNKEDAFILHFAGESNKAQQMEITARRLFNQRRNISQIEPPPNKRIPWQERRLMRKRIQNLKLFYDISELGWSMYLAAHLKFCHKRGDKVGIITHPGKYVLYRDCVDLMLPLPEEYIETFKNMPSDGNHLFDPKTNVRIRDHKLLSAPFKKAYPEYKDNIITSYSKFEGQRVFEKYKHSKTSERLAKSMIEGYNDCILIFPRYRDSKFQCRNISKEQWLVITDILCDQYKQSKIISIGTLNGAMRLDINKKNFTDLVGYDDNKTLDLMIAFCNAKLTRAAVGNQSGTVKITLLSGTPTFMFGDERQRHTVDENWAKTKCGFFECQRTGNGYVINDLDKLIKKTINFIDMV
jgi:lipopolysaccharide biosynthesis glycosyltransferase